MFRSITLYKTLSVLVLTATSVIMIGCGAGNPFPTSSYERGMLFVEQGKHPEAVSALDNFIRHNPTDSLASEAQYNKAMQYMEMEEYPLASVEFQILRKDYPVSDRAEDAYFQEGVSYYRQVGNIERDVTGAYEARLHFIRFAEAYPNSELVSQIVEYMLEISDMMVKKRLTQIEIYQRLHKWEAVAITIDDLLEDERSSRILDKALWIRAETANKMDDLDKEKAVLQRLIRDFPESSRVDDANSRLEKIAEELASKAEEAPAEDGS